ncbi:MAG: tRNA (adenosine(37)-N6)-threonylcarbamoyltransferase complex transferase subunit TsaD [Oscillospiraceae bacterium]|nr:tRNA (adenosine(37)-N6)-threonylcarbamoyltransferase complex transferase subunit TsaD [Oscillospiraceae bacterium]
MLILSVESTCDETAVAITENGRRVLTDQIFSQADLHAVYGGVVPEIASRSHVEVISRLADHALESAGVTRPELDAVAVSYAPGLIGAVLVGVNFAKSAAWSLGIPVIPVHHIRGHIAANYIAYPELTPPFLCLAISGGNTMLVHVRDYTDMVVLGRTRDDAAGECFDKSARVLGLPYPGGAPIDRLAREGRDDAYDLPRPYVGENPYDMSFSGLKTAVINIAHHAAQTGENIDRAGLAASLCRAVSDALVPRTMAAAAELGLKKIAVAGGVAANSRIRADFQRAAEKAGAELFIPPLRLCGDNAAMIGCQGYYEFLAGHTADWSLNAYANMAL